LQVKEVIVVEGKNDTNKIKKAVLADTIETNGSAISKDTLQLIGHAQKKRGVIIFTDPDYPGERIRHIIDKEIEGCKHAFLPKAEAKSKSAGKSVGIEHATIKSIQEALHHVYSLTSVKTSDIQKTDLLNYGLIGSKDAKRKREELGTLLFIGHTNGKQLLNRLHIFHISKHELDEAMMHILERGQNK